jgi:ABC-type lipoprotein export system ATPase subunit/ABC-type antimicrobial peptide transport system permease subunit
MIEIRKVHKYYGSSKHFTKALEDINLTLPDKGIVFIVGKSGSGKSTLLNILGGLDYPTSGEVIIDNKPLSKFSRADFDAYRNSHIGIIFQSFNLIDEMNVYDNIALSLKIQAIGHNFNTIEDALQSVGLDGMGYRKINELSGGQKQRIAIARVLVKNPKMILADEPTGSLDSVSGEEIIANLKVISKDKLVIVVTHDRLLAQKYGDRIIEISDGRVVSDLVRIEDLASNNSEFVSSNVARVPLGGKIANVEEINSKLNKDQNNYLLISTSIDKVVLAYPETFNSIYEKQDYDNDFAVNDKKEIKATKNLFLNKSKLPLKEALKMTKESLSKKRVRFTSLVFLATVALTLLSLASSLSNISNDTIVASTIKANNEKIITITKSTPNKSYFLDDDYAYLNSEFPLLKYAKTTDIVMQVESANPPAGMVNYYFKNFNGVIETNDVSTLGLKMISGTGKFTSSDDYYNIIISDYVASELTRQGFVAIKDGKYGIYFPLTYHDFVDMKILFKDGKFYNVKGVYETNFQEVNKNNPSDFKNLKDLYFGRAIVKPGFISDYIIGLDYYIVNTTIGYNFAGSGYSHYTTNDGISIYDKNKLQSRLLQGTLPDKLKDNEVVIDFTIFSRMLGSNSFESKQEVLNRWNWYSRRVFAPDFLLTLSLNNEAVATYSNFKIVALLDDIGQEKRGEMFFSEAMTENIKEITYLSKKLVMSSDASVDELTATIIDLRNSNFLVGTSSFKSYTSDTESLKTIANIATYGAVICGIFALLLIANFVIASIRSRQREIGILRSCGARPIDVSKIFLSEVIFSALVVSLLAVGLSIGGYQAINLVVSNNILPGMSIVTFRVSDGLNICAIAFASMIVVALIPIIKISYLKPIDALNDVY